MASHLTFNYMLSDLDGYFEFLHHVDFKKQPQPTLNQLVLCDGEVAETELVQVHRLRVRQVLFLRRQGRTASDYLPLPPHPALHELP